MNNKNIQDDFIIEYKQEVTNKYHYQKNDKGYFVIKEEWCRQDVIEFITEEEFNANRIEVKNE